MVDYKQTALQGAAVGAVLSLFFFKGRRGVSKLAKFGALGAALAITGGTLLKRRSLFHAAGSSYAGEEMLGWGDYTGALSPEEQAAIDSGQRGGSNQGGQSGQGYGGQGGMHGGPTGGRGFGGGGGRGYLARHPGHHHHHDQGRGPHHPHHHQDVNQIQQGIAQHFHRY